MNIKVRLKFKLTYYNGIVQHVNDYAIGLHPVKELICNKSDKKM